MNSAVIATLLLVGGVAGGGAGYLGRRLLCVVRRGVRPPPLWCEGAVAVLWAIVLASAAAGFLPWWWAPVPMALAWLAVLLATCDVVAGRLPDVLTLPAYPVAAVFLVVAAWWGSAPGLLIGAVAGLVIHAGIYALVRMISADAMGPGDVKLAGTLGAVVGAVSLPAVLVSMLAAAVLTLVLAGRRGAAGIPHGPAMLAPAWLATAFPAWHGGVW